MWHHLTRGIALTLATAPALAVAATTVVVHRDPGCGCCEQWAAQVRRQFGAQVRIVDDAGRAALRKKVGLPADLGSCHTALINGFAFEGHVPIADMKRLLAQKPAGISGLAVPGMPIGSPGMEVPGVRGQAFDVIAFGPGGRRVYAHHG